MKQKNWFKPKAFTHITNKLSLQDAQWIKNYVGEPKNIASHKFYPLIHKTISVRRYKLSKDKNGNAVKRHYTIGEDGKRKSNIKYREIYFPNHLDAHIYSYYTKEILEPKYEQLIQDSGLDSNILAYRRIPLDDDSRCKCNIDFANDACKEIKSSNGEIAILCFDISKFFDSLNHKKLKQAWTSLLGTKDLQEDHYNIYKSLTGFSYVELNDLILEFGYKQPKSLIEKNISCFVKDGKEFRERIKQKGYIKKNPFCKKIGTSSVKIGIPQGTPISAFLANLYLLEFDKKTRAYIENFSGVYRRYSDDILIICPKKYYLEVEDWIYSLITEFDLNIQQTKTQKTFFINGKLEKFEKPINYLGFQFDGHRKLIKQASVSKFYRKLKVGVKTRAYRSLKAQQKNMKGKTVDETLHRKKLYERFSYLGGKKKSLRKRNFFSYANFAAKIMNSPHINKQLSNAWSILHQEINKNEARYNLKRLSD